jgi:hypothetical protein
MFRTVKVNMMWSNQIECDLDKFGSGRNCGSFMLILRVNYTELKWRVGLLVMLVRLEIHNKMRKRRVFS